MVHEKARRRDRRVALHKLQQGEAHRRPMTPEEEASLVAALRKGDAAAFGLVKLSAWDLDGPLANHEPGKGPEASDVSMMTQQLPLASSPTCLQPGGPGPAETEVSGNSSLPRPKLTLLELAACLHKDKIVGALLRAGADASARHDRLGRPLAGDGGDREGASSSEGVKEDARACISAVPPMVGVFIVKNVVAMRVEAVHRLQSSALWQGERKEEKGGETCVKCGAQPIPRPLAWSSCKHLCCEGCLWAKLRLAGCSAGDPKDFACPLCDDLQDPMVSSATSNGPDQEAAEDGEVGGGEGRTTAVTRKAESLARWQALPEDLTPSASSAASAIAASAGMNSLYKDEDPRLCTSSGDRKGGDLGRPRFEARTPAAVARMFLGGTRFQRQQKMWRAAIEGDVERMRALVDAGVDVDGPNEYGQTPLHLASWHGQVNAVLLLLESFAADPLIPANGGSTCLSAARAQGHKEVVQALVAAASSATGATLRAADTRLDGLEDVPGHLGLPGEQYPNPYLNTTSSPSPPPVDPSSTSTATRVTRLIPLDADHPGAGAFYVDGALTQGELEALRNLWDRLPHAPYADVFQLYGGEVERSYYVDGEGWLRGLLRTAILRAEASLVTEGGKEGAEGAEGSSPLLGAGEALPYMRLLHYRSRGASVGPHVDLSKKEVFATTPSLASAVVSPSQGKVKGRQAQAPKRSSRLTFLLYLADGSQGEEEGGMGEGLGRGGGGETLLLERERPTLEECGRVLAAVEPKPGRLLVFPHKCPHAGAAVERPPKILVRGEFM